MGKLTPTMLVGLEAMERKLRRQSKSLAEPNENTGQALLKRGLIEFVGKENGWNYYVLTDAGRAALEANNG